MKERVTVGSDTDAALQEMELHGMYFTSEDADILREFIVR